MLREIPAIEIVEVLGGADRVGRIAHVATTTVKGWVRRGHVPDSQAPVYFAYYRACRWDGHNDWDVRPGELVWAFVAVDDETGTVQAVPNEFEADATSVYKSDAEGTVYWVEDFLTLAAALRFIYEAEVRGLHQAVTNIFEETV